MFVAFLILFNFAVNVYEKEIDPFPAELQLYGDVWENFDRFFNVIFLFELLLNAWSCGGPYKKFWASGWNNFDFLVVAVGILLMSGVIPSDSPLSNLKMMRAFRVFRLFKRIKSLNKVIMALLKAIPGVSNAFVIMVIFMMIYAIIAVEYFAQLGQGCEGREEAGGPDGKCFGLAPYNTFITFNDDGTNQTLSAQTDRGFAFGWEYYGTFTRALFTLFQVMTGEAWAEAVARPLMFGLYKENAILVSVFFVSFILLMQIVLTNVVVAVLLDKFVEDPVAGEGDEDEPPQLDASLFLDGLELNAGLDSATELYHGASAADGAAAAAGSCGDAADGDLVLDLPPPEHRTAGKDGSSPATTVSSRVPSPTAVPGVQHSAAGHAAAQRPKGCSKHTRRRGAPSPVHGGQQVHGLVGLSVDDKLSMLLQEMASLRVAVSRCEAGIDELRRATHGHPAGGGASGGIHSGSSGGTNLFQTLDPDRRESWGSDALSGRVVV